MARRLRCSACSGSAVEYNEAMAGELCPAACGRQARSGCPRVCSSDHIGLRLLSRTRSNEGQGMVLARQHMQRAARAARAPGDMPRHRDYFSRTYRPRAPGKAQECQDQGLRIHGGTWRTRAAALLNCLSPVIRAWRARTRPWPPPALSRSRALAALALARLVQARLRVSYGQEQHCRPTCDLCPARLSHAACLHCLETPPPTMCSQTLDAVC